MIMFKCCNSTFELSFKLSAYFINSCEYREQSAKKRLCGDFIINAHSMYRVDEYTWSLSGITPSLYPRSPNLCLEVVVDCVGKPRIFIQCSCLIAPPRGYESAL